MIEFKRIKSNNPKLYYSFSFIEFTYIDTNQVRSVNIVFLNYILKLTKTKTTK